MAAAVPVPVTSQVVKGHLMDFTTRAPIVLASVALVDSALTVVDQTLTSGDGAFALTAPAPGKYYVAAGRQGYASRRDGPIELALASTISVEFYLRPEAIGVDTLSVETRRGRASARLASVGFLERLDAGLGWFLTPEDLETRRGSNIAALLRSAPGAHVLDMGSATSLLFRSAGVPFTCSGPACNSANATSGRREWDPEGYCTPLVIVDGVQAAIARQGVAGAMIDDAVSVQDVVAIEVHTGPASVPMQYSGMSAGCSIVLIWTHRE